MVPEATVSWLSRFNFKTKLIDLTSICTVSVALICSSSFNRFPSDVLTSSSSLLPLEKQIYCLLKQTRNDGYDSKLHGNDLLSVTFGKMLVSYEDYEKTYVLKTEALQNSLLFLKERKDSWRCREILDNWELRKISGVIRCSGVFGVPGFVDRSNAGVLNWRNHFL